MHSNINDILGNDYDTPGHSVKGSFDYNLFCKKYWYRPLPWLIRTVNFDNIELIKKAVTKPILINAASDPDTIDSILNFIRIYDLGDKVAAVLVNDMSAVEKVKSTKLVFFPTLAYKFHHDWKYVQYPMDFDSRNHKLLCFNRAPEVSRALTFYYLSQFPWFDQVKFSFYGMSSFGDNNMPNKAAYNGFLRYTGKEGEAWIRKQNFPISVVGDVGWDNMPHKGCHNPYNYFYVSSYANLCTESSGISLTITEKSMKAIAAGNLLWTVSAPNHMNVLANMGFDLKFENMDFDKYDTIEDLNDRVIACVENVAENFNNIPEIWHQHKSQLKKNREWLFSEDFKQHLISNIKDLL